MVSGDVRRPDGVKTPVTLVDDGASMDGAANDGIYGFPYGATIPGAYYVNLKASGTSNAGVAFGRYLTTAFVLPGERHRSVPPGEGLSTPPQGKSCSLAIFLLLLLSILLIVVAWQKPNWWWCLLIAILLILIAALVIWFCCRR
jgi:hypothetical protein